MYKGLIFLYLAIFSFYVLFTRIPDYFEGDYIKGVVSQASFSSSNNAPLLVVDYNVGSEKLQYKTNEWFLKKYKAGDAVTIIYNPAEPTVASIYAIVGYWVKWPELLLTAVFFVILFIAAKTIAGNNGTEHNSDQNPGKKRKYDK